MSTQSSEKKEKEAKEGRKEGREKGHIYKQEEDENYIT